MFSPKPETNRDPWTTQVAGLAPDAVQRLVALRRRFEEGQDRFTERELAYLNFLRWLVQSGRLES